MTQQAMPIVRLEVSSMKQTLAIAVTDHMAAIDEQVQEAIKQACTPENLLRVLQTAVDSALNEVITEEVVNFYRRGAGRAVVRAAVHSRLNIVPNHGDY